MKIKFKILVIDSDQSIRNHEKDFLDSYDLSYLAPQNFDEIDECLKFNHFDLVLINSNLSALDYLEIIGHIKKTHSLPVIIIMDTKKESIDKIVTFEMGADNIITHPFEWRELVARIKAILRLVHTTEENTKASLYKDGPNLAYFNEWMLDLDNKNLCSATKEAPELTAAEFRLLKALCTTPKRAICREKLLKISHHGHNASNDRSIDILIARLRKKLSDVNGRGELIKTVRGVGYMLNTEVQYSNSASTQNRRQIDMPLN